MRLISQRTKQNVPHHHTAGSSNVDLHSSIALPARCFQTFALTECQFNVRSGSSFKPFPFDFGTVSMCGVYHYWSMHYSFPCQYESIIIENMHSLQTSNARTIRQSPLCFQRMFCHRHQNHKQYSKQPSVLSVLIVPP